MVFVEEVVRLLQMSGVIKDGFGSLGSSLLSHGDLVIKVLGNWRLDDLSDHVSWNTVRLHADDPVVNGKLTFSLLDDFLKLLDGLLVRVLPSIELHLDDAIETFVFWENSVDTFKILFVALKNLKEALHAKDIPPAVSLHDGEATSEDVSDITTTSDIGWKSTI